MSRSLNQSERKALAAMVARTSLAEVLKEINLCHSKRTILTLICEEYGSSEVAAWIIKHGPHKAIYQASGSTAVTFVESIHSELLKRDQANGK